MASACLDNKSNLTQPQIKQKEQKSIWREQIIEVEAKDKKKKKEKWQPKHTNNKLVKELGWWAGKMARWIKAPTAKPEFNP